ncbi:MAG: DUF3604 domain-containing protein, partial [Halioglobus sp.]|nr:DUF3604 domain-containing protein [Halioglobus sp.]
MSAVVALSAPGAAALDDGDGTANNCTQFNSLNDPYFGDTHVHTTLSFDAFIVGTDTTPEQAYDFAQGTQIGLHPFDQMGNPGRTAQIDRPLDFAMISDHAEYFGEYNICMNPAHPSYNTSQCVHLRARSFTAALVWIGRINEPQDEVMRFDFCGPTGSLCTIEAPTLWQQLQQAASQHYDRTADCTFTTFVGYEWSGSPTRFNQQGQFEHINLHRNVIFRNSIVPALPTSYFDAPYPEQLYDALDADCIDATNPGGDCDALIIPHNSNLSQGVTFENINPAGSPYNVMDAVQRARFERVIEVIQHKGASECNPNFHDPLCDFEFLPGDTLIGAPAEEAGSIRDALKKGLQARGTIGANPHRLGMIGGTDTHIGTPGLVEESQGYPGHTGGTITPGTGVTDLTTYNPGGLAVVWAPQNSRAALFDAMRRREVYGTSGPRHIVRFFGGYDIPTDICSQPNLVQVAYNNGVPMGSDLPMSNPTMASPRFMVSAMKDAGTVGFPGNDLQRIQIIKGWTDAQGTAHEQVYEVAGDPNNGAGVDLNT